MTATSSGEPWRRGEPLRILPPTYRPLDNERRTRAVAALADLLARELHEEGHAEDGRGRASDTDEVGLTRGPVLEA